MKENKKTIFELASRSPQDMAVWMVYQIRNHDGSIGYTYANCYEIDHWPTRMDAIKACMKYLETEVMGVEE